MNKARQLNKQLSLLEDTIGIEPTEIHFHLSPSAKTDLRMGDFQDYIIIATPQEDTYQMGMVIVRIKNLAEVY